MKPRTILIAPTINEFEAIREILPRIDRRCLDDIVVVDLNSTDGTIEYCLEHGYTLHRQQTKGYGAGIKEVLAITNQEIVIEFPPDGSSPPDRIPDLIRKLEEGYDFVIASRYRDGARSYDDDVVTKIGNRIFTFVVNLLFRTSYSDVLIGYRAYRRSALQRLQPTCMGLDWSVQLPIQFAKSGARVTEIGVDEPKRIGGVRKMRPVRTGLAILKVVILEFLNRKPVKNTVMPSGPAVVDPSFTAAQYPAAGDRR
jgi:glycosyltransferase involved in cell wall biosynthesis